MRGQCLCGAVEFEVDVPMRTYSVCHCGLCRRWSGGPLMSVHCPEPKTKWLNNEGLTWYQGTPWPSAASAPVADRASFGGSRRNRRGC